jgi:hypothetical protein
MYAAKHSGWISRIAVKRFRPRALLIYLGNYCCIRQQGRLYMIPNLSRKGAFQAISDGAKPDPWSALRWGILVPVAVVGNVALAIIAWYVVKLTMKLF